MSVTDEQGREVKGRIVSMTTDALTIATGGERTDVRYAEIVKIDQKDGLKNGALIGLAAGGVLGVLLVLPGDCETGAFLCGDPHAGNYIAAGLVVGGLGAALGTGIDALVGGDRTIYRRGGGTRISLSPVFGRERVGAVFSASGSPSL